MKKQTFKKFTILGLVLAAASAVTAAIIPSQASNAMTEFSLTYTNPAGSSTLSCSATVAAANPCGDATATGAGSGTTGGFPGSGSTNGGTTGVE